MTGDRITALLHSPLTLGLGVAIFFGCPGMSRYRKPPPPPQLEIPRDMPPRPYPPGQGPKTGASPGRSQPSAPRGVDIPTPGARAPAPRRGPGGSTGGITLGIDGNAWSHWWSFNQSAFLLPRLNGQVLTRTQPANPSPTSASRLGARRPLGRADAEAIAKDLRQILKSRNSNQQMRTASLMSLAKIRRGTPSDFVPKLRDPIPDVRETSILAMGIAAVDMEELIAIAENKDRARLLLGGRAPSYRERTFACYALGTLAGRTEDLEDKATVLRTLLVKAIQDDERWDVRIAALHSLRLMRAPLELWEPSKPSLQHILATALASEAKVSTLFRVHALSALRAPMSKLGHMRELAERRLLRVLSDKRTSLVMRQVCVQTLGFLSDEEDEDVRNSLMRISSKDRNILTRRFAMIALGRIGGAQTQDFLLEGFGAHRPHRGDYAWLAIALAISCQEKQEDGTLAWAEPRPGIGEAIHKRFKKMNSRMPAAGLAIALGLLQHEPAAKDIAMRMQRWRKHDEPAGFLAVALALTEAPGSTDRLLQMLEEAKGRQGLVVQTSLALALLRDRRAERAMLDKLQSGESLPVLVSMALALGRFGTRTSVIEMRKALASEESPRWLKSVLIVALGEIMVQKQLPWNSRLSWGIHYRFAPATLIGHGGILDKI